MSRALRWAAVAAWGLAAHAHVNARLLRRPARPGRPDRDARPPRVSALVPARDEAANIGPCVRALLDQRGVDVEVLVLDDGSADGTASVARSAGGGDPRVRVLAGDPPPPGWLGKPHACAQLAAAASHDVLVFVDADVRVHPDGLRATVDMLRRHGLALVSPYPRQLADGPGPRLVQPLLQWSYLTFLPLALAERLPAPSLVAANGQLLACDARAYRACGGHTGVRDAVIEDVALARAVKRAGMRATVADGTEVATCRMYPSWGDLRDGYAKSLWAAFRSPAGAGLAMGTLAGLYVVPAAAALTGLVRRRPAPALAGLVGYAGGVAGRVVSARRTGGRVADAAAHPLSVIALAYLTADSWRRRAAGQLTWKGRPVG